MSHDAEHSTCLSSKELDAILSSAWETAARRNPMLLMKLNPDFAFQHLRGVIKDCLTKGMPPNEISAYVVQELLASSAATGSGGSGSDGQYDEQVSS